MIQSLEHLCRAPSLLLGKVYKALDNVHDKLNIVDKDIFQRLQSNYCIIVMTKIDTH